MSASAITEIVNHDNGSPLAGQAVAPASKPLRVPCPGKEGSKGCIEHLAWTTLDSKTGKAPAPHFPRVHVNAGNVCVGCRRGRPRYSAAEAVQKSNEVKMGSDKKDIGQQIRNDLFPGVGKADDRPEQLHGTSRVVNVLDIMDLKAEDLLAGHELIGGARAAKDYVVTKLFDFVVGNKNGTLRAHSDLTARWQVYFPRSDTPSDIWNIDSVAVQKLRKGELNLQKFLVCGKEAPLKLGKHLKVGDSSFLYSLGKEEQTKLMPPELFVDQAAHTDHPDCINTFKAAMRGWPFPASCIVTLTGNSYINGYGPITPKLPDGSYPDLPQPIKIHLKNPGDMVIFRGDYVHSGGSYNVANTRLHLSIEPMVVPENATHLEDLGTPAPKWLVDESGYNAYGTYLGEPRTTKFVTNFKAAYSLDLPPQLMPSANKKKRKARN